MAAAESEESWLDLQRQRERRMRYELLALLVRLSEEKAGHWFDAADLGEELGAWQGEVYRVLDWLDKKGFVSGWGVGRYVSATLNGVERIRAAHGGGRELGEDA